MVDVTALDQLFEIVGNIGAEIVAAGTQFAGGQFLVADIEQQQRLHGINLALVAAIQFVLDDIEKLAVKPLNQIEGFEIMLAYGRCAFQRLRSLRFGHRRHFDTHTPLFAGSTLLLSPD